MQSTTLPDRVLADVVLDASDDEKGAAERSASIVQKLRALAEDGCFRDPYHLWRTDVRLAFLLRRLPKSGGQPSAVRGVTWSNALATEPDKVSLVGQHDVVLQTTGFSTADRTDLAERLSSMGLYRSAFVLAPEDPITELRCQLEWYAERGADDAATLDAIAKAVERALPYDDAATDVIEKVVRTSTVRYCPGPVDGYVQKEMNVLHRIVSSLRSTALPKLHEALTKAEGRVQTQAPCLVETVRSHLDSLAQSVYFTFYILRTNPMFVQAGAQCLLALRKMTGEEIRFEPPEELICGEAWDGTATKGLTEDEYSTRIWFEEQRYDMHALVEEGDMDEFRRVKQGLKDTAKSDKNIRKILRSLERPGQLGPLDKAGLGEIPTLGDYPCASTGDVQAEKESRVLRPWFYPKTKTPVNLSRMLDTAPAETQRREIKMMPAIAQPIRFVVPRMDVFDGIEESEEEAEYVSDKEEEAEEDRQEEDFLKKASEAEDGDYAWEE